MNDPRHNERLLADVLGEGASVDFRERLLNETLHLVRRRRHLRQARRAASALAVLAALGLLVWHRLPLTQAPSGFVSRPYALVRTRPLPPTACVATKPFPATGLVASLATRSIVVTAEAGVRVPELNDDELLALVPKPAALVRCGPHCAELVFVNQVDRDELLRN